MECKNLYVLKDSTNSPDKDILCVPVYDETDTEYKIEFEDNHRLIFIDKNTLKVSRNFQIYPYNLCKYFTSFEDAKEELKRELVVKINDLQQVLNRTISCLVEVCK